MSGKEWFCLATSGRANPDWRCRCYVALYHLDERQRLTVAFEIEKDIWAKFAAATYLRRLAPKYGPVIYYLESFLKERYGQGIDLVEWEKLLSSNSTPMQIREKERTFFELYPFRENSNETAVKQHV